MTTLIAAESTGAVAGLGMRIRSLNNSFESAPMLLYIIIIGIIGMFMVIGLFLFCFLGPLVYNKWGEIDLDEIKKVREELPLLKNKREDLYEVIKK